MLVLLNLVIITVISIQVEVTPPREMVLKKING